MRGLLLLICLAVLAVPASAPAQSGERPRVYVIVVDGLDGDRVDDGGAPFISSLLAGNEGATATYYRESRSVMIAETNPNHAAMATGAYGGTSGIPGNAFAVYGTPPDEDGCPAGGLDESRPPTVVSGESASCLEAETLFESIDRQDGAELTTAGIFGKPKLGRIFSGRRPDNRTWADYMWAPCEGSSDATDYCARVPTNPITGYSIDDAQVIDQVIRVARDGVPADGTTKRPDFTFVNLPQVDSAGHATGTGSVYAAAIAMADDEIRRFVQAQRELGDWGRRTVLILLSDHSMDSTPEKTSVAERFRTAGIPSDSYEIVQNGSASLVYLTNRTDPGRFALLKRMREAAVGTGNSASELVGQGPISEAWYREPNPADGGAANTLDARRPDWHLAGPRSGDLFLNHRAGGAFSDPINPLAGNHGGSQTRDNFLAVIGPPRLVRQQALAAEARPDFDDTAQNRGQAENVDVAPTAARLLGRSAPADSQGRFLSEAFYLDALPTLGRLRATVSPKRVRAGRRVRLAFRVTANGRPVERARISIGRRKLRTDSRGVARTTITLNKTGLRRARIGASGFTKTAARIRVLRR